MFLEWAWAGVAASVVEEASVEAWAEVLEEVLVAVEDSSVVSEVHHWDTAGATGGGGKCRVVMDEEIDIDGGTI
jgi:hypothetical protein